MADLGPGAAAAAEVPAAEAPPRINPKPMPSIVRWPDGKDRIDANSVDNRDIDQMNIFLDRLNMEINDQKELVTKSAGVGISTDGELRDRVMEILWPRLHRMDEIVRKLSSPGIGVGKLTEADRELHGAIQDIVSHIDQIPGIESTAFKNSFERLALGLAELQARVLLRECPPPPPCDCDDPEECKCPDAVPIIEGVVKAIDSVTEKVEVLSKTAGKVDDRDVAAAQVEQAGGYRYKYIKYKTKYHDLRRQMSMNDDLAEF